MVGNDVVDLREAAPRHPRFDARVFDPVELAQIESDPTLRWTFWAAKEAAYKRARRDDAAVVFSPRRFVVEMSTGGRGRVAHGSREWFVQIETGDHYVHAVAADSPQALSRTFARVAAIDEDEDQSGAVRRLAIDDLASRLDLSPRALRVERRGRIPWIRIAQRPEETPISLSHHGRFVAYACLAEPRELRA